VGDCRDAAPPFQNKIKKKDFVDKIMSNVLRDLRDLRFSLKQSVKSADGRCIGMVRGTK